MRGGSASERATCQKGRAICTRRRAVAGFLGHICTDHAMYARRHLATSYAVTATVMIDCKTTPVPSVQESYIQARPRSRQATPCIARSVSGTLQEYRPSPPIGNPARFCDLLGNPAHRTRTNALSLPSLRHHPALLDGGSASRIDQNGRSDRRRWVPNPGSSASRSRLRCNGRRRSGWHAGYNYVRLTGRDGGALQRIWG